MTKRRERVFRRGDELSASGQIRMIRGRKHVRENYKVPSDQVPHVKKAGIRHAVHPAEANKKRSGEIFGEIW